MLKALNCSLPKHLYNDATDGYHAHREWNCTITWIN